MSTRVAPRSFTNSLKFSAPAGRCSKNSLPPARRARRVVAASPESCSMRFRSRSRPGMVSRTARVCSFWPLRKGSHSRSLSFSIQRYGSLSVSPKYVSFTMSTRATGAGGMRTDAEATALARRARKAPHTLPAPTNKSRRLMPFTCRAPVLNDSPLMKDDLPPDSAALPDGRAARPALALQQRVGEEVDTGGQLAAVEIVRSPGVLHRLIEARRNRFQDVLAAVAAPGGADLPEVVRRHGLELGARAGELRPVKYRLPAAQLLEDREILGQGDWLRHGAHLTGIRGCPAASARPAASPGQCRRCRRRRARAPQCSRARRARSRRSCRPRGRLGARTRARGAGGAR